MQYPTGSPEWWRERLLVELTKRSRHVQRMEDYYDGRHPLPQPPPAAQKAIVAQADRALRYLLDMSVTNFVRMVADAPAERLRVTGFRFGESTSDDSAAWRLWQQNKLDADSARVQGAALQTGQSAVLVWPSREGVSITPEHPGQVIVAYEPGTIRERAAGLKRWYDYDGHANITLYLPDKVWKWRSRRPGNVESPLLVVGEQGADHWVKRQPTGETWPLVNPFGRVPLVEFRANWNLRPSLFGGGESEFAQVIPIQNRINKVIYDGLVTGESQAFKQRVIAGWDPLAGIALDDHVAMEQAGAHARMMMGASLAWTFESPDTKVTELGQADIRQFGDVVDGYVRHMASITKTPEWSLLRGTANPPSADALRASLADLVAKTVAHADNFGEAWEDVIRLGLDAVGDPRSADEQTEVRWADMETRTWGETVDAVVKMATLGVPRRPLWERLPNVSPQELDRWELLSTTEALLAPPADGAT